MLLNAGRSRLGVRVITWFDRRNNRNGISGGRKERAGANNSSKRRPTALLHKICCKGGGTVPSEMEKIGTNNIRESTVALASDG